MLYHQWLKGAHNQVADSLSRDVHYLSIKSHESFLSTVIPHQLPQNFKIKPLPKEITCFLSSILQELPETKQWLKEQKPSELAAGNIGILTSIASELQMSSSMTSNYCCKTQLFQGSGKPCDRAPSLQEIRNNWWKEQSRPPCHKWHRPLGQTTGMTQDWTEMARRAITCQNNLEVTEMKTRK